jgi:probable rRNA maturation factor
MRILNRQYRGIDKPTDVLSFPQISDFEFRNSESKKQKSHFPHSPFRISQSNFILGDIVINLHQAKRQAAEYGITFQEELKKLLIHGILHLLNYDHEKNKYSRKKMLTKEKDLLDTL